MSILGWIVLGGLAGWIASMITGRNDRMGCITNIAAYLGVVVFRDLIWEAWWWLL
jgi:uncharacterized membrane protein YeaQ/YmgE (transglycosylase-associated protein family)